MARTKLLTDYSYSPTSPASEDAIREEIDGSIQEVYDAAAKPEDTVNLVGDQTVSGVKTFSSSPVVPTPTTNMQASTKKYVDDGLLSNKNGDHLGTWQGRSPVESDPGIQAIVNENTSKIDNSFYADIQAYYGNTYLLSDFQDVSEWTVLSGAFVENTSTVKIGERTYGGANAEKTIDITSLNNGEDVENEDYLFTVVYGVANDTAVVELKNSGGSVLKTINITLTSGTWSYDETSLTGVTLADVDKIEISCTTDNSNARWQLIQLVKKDPEEEYPNPFQKFGVRDFSINNGGWFVGYEFGQLVWKDLRENADVYALISDKGYQDFTYNIIKKVDANSYNRYQGWSFDTSNRLIYYVNDNVLTFIVHSSASGQVNHTRPLTIVDGDIISYKLTKKGNGVSLEVSVNYGVPILINTSADFSNTVGYMTFGTEAVFGRGGTIKSASITNISHAHHSDIAEVAKTLTVKYQAGAFIADELNYGEYGVDTANNRIYVKKSATQVMHFTGTVV